MGGMGFTINCCALHTSMSAIRIKNNNFFMFDFLIFNFNIN